MAIAGYRAMVKISGEPVLFTGEPATELPIATPGRAFQITDPMKQIVDRERPVSVYVNDTEVEPDRYRFNRLTGTVVFNEALSSESDVTIDGSYIPLVNAAECREYSYTLEATNVDNTSFGHSVMTRAQSSKSVSGSLGGWYVDDMFTNFVLNNNVLLLEFYANVDRLPDLRVWAALTTTDITIGDLIEDSIEWETTTDASGNAFAFPATHVDHIQT